MTVLLFIFIKKEEKNACFFCLITNLVKLTQKEYDNYES